MKTNGRITWEWKKADALIFNKIWSNHTMTEFEFLPEIPIDTSHTLDQLTARFQGVKDGLPELVKNAKDQYARLRIIDPKERQIVVIANSRLRALAVLDFAGATAEDFDGWRTWSSRTANRAEQSHDIEGGHGNGGKAFMVRGSVMESTIESCAHGVRTKMGFRNDQPESRYLPAFARENRRRICDLPERNPRAPLETALNGLELSITDLPEYAQEVLERRQAFTLVRIDGVRDWHQRRASKVRSLLGSLPDELAGHAQAALTLETCSLCLLVDGRRVSSEPLAPNYPAPLEEFQPPRRVAVPESLFDPDTREMISTGEGDAGTKYLELRTSREQLRISDRRKALNAIRIRNLRNIVASWSMADLVPRAESAFIYGTLQVPALTGEHHAGTDWRDLADTPLVRALRKWVSEEVDGLASQIQQARSRQHRQEDRARANDALNRLRELMRHFLEADPLPGDSNGNGPGVCPEPPRPPRPKGSIVNEIILENGLRSIAFAVGSEIPLLVRCYEVTPDGKRLPVPGAPVAFHAIEDGIVLLTGRGLLRLTAVGQCH
jgi:hypothetical protein